jgi:hypothetical protein
LEQYIIEDANSLIERRLEELNCFRSVVLMFLPTHLKLIQMLQK